MIVGQSVASGQFNNISSSRSEFTFNISEVQNEQAQDVMEFLMNENITISDDIANISGQVLCSNEAIRGALVMIASVDIACGECG